MVMLGKSRTLFSIQAKSEASTLARVLELFIVRGIFYDTVSAKKTEDGMQWISLLCCDVEDQNADIILNKIRQIVTVQAAQVETTLLSA